MDALLLKGTEVVTCFIVGSRHKFFMCLGRISLNSFSKVVVVGGVEVALVVGLPMPIEHSSETALSASHCPLH